MLSRFVSGKRLLSSLLLLSASTLCAMAAPAPQDQIALQGYTLRNVGSLEQQYAMAHDAGFKAIEIVSDQGVSPQQLNDLLNKYQLKVTSDHVHLADLEAETQKIIDFNQAINNHTIIVSWLTLDERPDSAEGWKQMGQRLDKLGATLKKQGMQLGYHNHNFEMKKYAGKTALEIMLDNASAQNLQVELDVAWVSRGGQDPVRFLQKYPGRIFAIHAKDNASIGVRDDEMNFAPPGSGILAWNEILPAAEKAGTRWYIVEHDLPKDPRAIITAGKSYLEQTLK
ncbi:sugar phosphate isomerase/epimerase [Erwinia toletana]|uniref:Sugar phosphate isomerase/epimerase n=1 Tax=Winslowiella toletana TaxID=92490 RepID=A0ABS4P9X0_9GAMM|nr:sugar phosphate isomerase/epimerase [Winslowiella toletana]